MIAEGVVIAVVSAASGLVVAFWQRRSAQEETVASQYQALVKDLDKLKHDYQEENRELRERLRGLETEQDRLKRHLARMEEASRLADEKVKAAVEYIVVLRGLVPAARRPPVPEELRALISVE
ncbi:hypothetical protein [Corynebacterium mastitidis]|uniref:hypothetical protein n=1 Tax=Corynebacterium mastitidis TaxID=161890 RepID=UPI0003689561|nr:hypothetical protein [Corynebacterium mastitidis]